VDISSILAECLVYIEGQDGFTWSFEGAGA